MKRIILVFLFLFLSSSAQAVGLFAVCTTTCTWDNSSTAMWSTSSGGATGAGPPGIADSATFDASTCVGGTTCTITVNANIHVVDITMGACTASTTGCVLDFSANNNNVTVDHFNGSGNGKRALNMGNGTWNVGGVLISGNLWNFITTGNLTFNANNSSLIVTASSLGTVFFFTGPNAAIYHNVSVTGSISIIGVSTTFDTLTIIAPSYVVFSNFTTFTVNTAFNVTSSMSAQVGTSSDSSGAAFGLILPTNTTMSWVSIRDGNFSGSGSTPVATNSFDLKNNLNITITPPNGGQAACILGGWLLWRDIPEHINDNFPAWLEKAA